MSIQEILLLAPKKANTLPIKSGIYCIINLINNKFYIGKSTDIKARFRNHQSKLRLNKHPNQHLQNAYNKYGVSNFKYLVIDKCDNSFLAEKEGFYLRILNPMYNIDFINSSNITVLAESTKKLIGQKSKDLHKNKIGFTDMVIKAMTKNGPWNKGLKVTCPKKLAKMSETAKKHGSPQIKTKEAIIKSGISRRKKVYQYDLKGNFIKEFEWIYDIPLLGNKSQKSQSKYLSFRITKKQGYAYNFIWSYFKLNTNGTF